MATRTMFTGAGTALVTPFTTSGAVDEPAVKRLARRQIDAGIHFLVPCGTTGETPTLSAAERRRVVELVLRESNRIVRMDGGHLIVETGPGWVCANAGIDESNAVRDGQVTLLPVDADASAERLRAALRSHLGVDLGVVVTDTFGRPWREGQVEVALGVAGIEPLLDLRGTRDLNGHELRVTVIGVADELAGAAGLVMGKSDGVAAVIVRGWQAPAPPANADPARPRGGRALIRRRETDLFR